MSERRILLLSGPNLNLLGAREPEIYGASSLDDHVASARRAAERNGFALEHLQSNAESDLVAAVHSARDRCEAIVINAAALTHYGWSLHDALAAFTGVVIELHLSNTARRERWRHDSVVSPVADGVIMGLGGHGYDLAVEAAARLVDDRSQRPR